jgi:predicted alpha/beta superfamily hydrolase
VQAYATAAGERQPGGTINSASTNWSYPLQVYLPPGYAESDRTYPVLYAMDARVRFDRIADILDAADLQIIMIGIGTTGEVRREFDFTMPGARSYAGFLSDELVPWVDARYRTDPSARGLAGHSLAGLMTALTLLLENPDSRRFNLLLVSDGSFWSQPKLTQGLIRQLRDATDTLPVKLFMTGATKGNNKGARNFHAQIRDGNFAELELSYKVYELDHRAVIGPSLRDGLIELFSGTD